MKISFLFFIYILFFRELIFSQKKEEIKNDYLTLVSAIKETQVTGAHSPNGNNFIYNISWHANKSFYLKDILGIIGNNKVKGKLIYNNSISDSAVIREANNFTIRYEINNKTYQTNIISDKDIYDKKRCSKGKEIKKDKNVIYLSFLIENKQRNFRLECTERKMPAGVQLPE